MPVIKIGRRTVSDIGAVEKPTVFYDVDLKGFGLKVLPSGSRSWIAEYRPGASGRGTAKRRIVLGPYNLLTPDEARSRAKGVIASARVSEDPASLRAKERAAITVSELLDAFLKEHVKVRRKGGTADLYTGIVENHIRPAFGSAKASKIATAEVAKLHLALADMPYQANRVLAVLGAAYGFGERRGLVPEGYNPARKVERYAEKSRERFLTDKEMQALGEALREAETIGLPYSVDASKPKAKHAPKADNRRTVFSRHATDAIRLLILTGCRLREILKLRWTEVDFQRGLLLIPDSKTGKKAVVLNAAALDILNALPRLGVYVIASDSAGTKDEKPRHDLKKPWAAISKHAGLGGVRLHDLRHSFASVGAGDGLGLPVIGKLLGHTQAATTQRYAHLDSDPLRKASNAIGRKISAALEGK